MSRLIDADKLKQHYAWWENGSAEMTLDEAKRTFDTIIDVQPTVDAVPLEDYRSMGQTVDKLNRVLLADITRLGHWEWHEDNREWFCSECKRFVYGVSLEVMSGEYKFCPHCGAKMDEVEEDETN